MPTKIVPEKIVKHLKNLKSWNLLPPKLRAVLRNQKNVVCIIGAENYVCFTMKNKSKKIFRVLFCLVVPWISKARIFQVNRGRYINKYFLNGNIQGPPDWNANLINDMSISISEPYREIFMKKLPQMDRLQVIRLKNLAIRHKRLFSSKYDA